MNGVEILEFQKKSLKELEVSDPTLDKPSSSVVAAHILMGKQVHPSSGTIGFGV